MTSAVENHTFDEIQIGESASIMRTLTTKDIDLFAVVSGDLNPTHMDPDRPAGGADTVVAHSMWAGTLFSGVLGNLLPGPGTVYKDQNFHFHQPVRLGDTLEVTVTAKEKRSTDGVVLFECQGTNQRNELIVDGVAEVLAPTEKIRLRGMVMPDVGVRRHEGYEKIAERCEGLDPVTTAVAHPAEANALKGAIEAAEAGLIHPILVGPQQRLQAVAQEAGVDISRYRLVDTRHSHESAARAVALIRGGEADMLMKGSLHTDELMAAVVSSKTGLRTERRVSHVFVMDVPTYQGILMITDAAVNIFPDLQTKRDICQNAIDLALSLGIKQPRVAVLSAVETVTPKIPSTVEAAALCKMAERGQITGGILDGPLAMDNAISLEAARQKSIHSEVAGRAQILVAPDLEAGNILAKQLTFLTDADAAGVVLGARVPIVLTSRADNVRTRLASCGVAMLHAHAMLGEEPLEEEQLQQEQP